MVPGSNIKTKDLVLVGGGHSHVEVLRQLAMHPVDGLRVTLISRDAHTPYSGMLPGFVAGHYTWDDIHIDLAPLCARAGARLIAGRVERLNLDDGYVQCDGRPPIRYDALSINTGSAPSTGEINGADRIGIPVKPIDQFVHYWQTLLQRLQSEEKDQYRLIVVGAGAGGVELALSMQHRLTKVEGLSNIDIAVITADAMPLADHNSGVQSRLRKRLDKAGIAVRLNTRIAAAETNRLQTDGGDFIDADAVLWVTQAAATSWPADAGLETDADGFVRVNAYLQSVSHPEVFAAGDVATMDGQRRPKSGVFAVRQGPVLADNLRRWVCGRPLRSYRPQKHFLSLISTGDRRAVASRGGFAAQGVSLWYLKNWIDRRFMDRYKVGDAPMKERPVRWKVSTDGTDSPAADDMRCGGCGAKLGGDLLMKVLNRLRVATASEVVAGIGDDAAVLRPVANTLEVHTIDGFRAMFDDPYLLGRIAAEHSINDIYAMGGLPRTALIWAQVPFGGAAQMEDDLYQMMAGALTALDDCGASLVGGHSGEAAELGLGVAVTGSVHERDVWQNGRITPGDYLVLTKPLGTGALLAAHMRARCRGSWLSAATESMQQSNRAAVDIFRRARVKACTDISGFGLLGHMRQLVQAGNLGAAIWPEAVPLLPGVSDTIRAGILSSLHTDNVVVLESIDLGNFAADDVRVRALLDPQTSGGLLGAVRPEKAEACLAELNAAGYTRAAVVGRTAPVGHGEHWAKMQDM